MVLLGFQTRTNMKTIVFWDLKPCRLVSRYQFQRNLVLPFLAHKSKLCRKGISKYREEKAGTRDASKSMGNNDSRGGCFINKQEKRLTDTRKHFLFSEEWGKRFGSKISWKKFRGGSTGGKIIWHIKGGEGREICPQKRTYQVALTRQYGESHYMAYPQLEVSYIPSLRQKRHPWFLQAATTLLFHVMDAPRSLQPPQKCSTWSGVLG